MFLNRLTKKKNAIAAPTERKSIVMNNLSPLFDLVIKADLCDLVMSTDLYRLVFVIYLCDIWAQIKS